MPGVERVILDVQRLLAEGRTEQARSQLQRALQRDANQPDLVHAMAITLMQGGQREQALYFAQRAAGARPDVGEYLSTLGGIQSALGLQAEAEATLTRALEIDPGSLNARLALANVMSATNRHGASAACCRAALEIRPDDSQIVVAYARALVNLGRATEGVAEVKRLLAARPGDAELLGSLPFASNYLAVEDLEGALGAHRQGAALIESGVKPLPPAGAAADPGRKLVIGLVSPDLRTHSVAFFIEPVLRHLDREAFDVVCYSSAHREDMTTERLKALPVQWRRVAELTPDRIAALVRSDKVDILIDLAGYTGRGTLAVFAMRAAPVQATYLGYPNTTGLSAMDYRLVDRATDPEGHDKYATERLVRVEGCFLCYAPPADAPPVTQPPSASGSPPTFGSFNMLAKINESVVAAWSRLLVETPGSRLLLKAVQLGEPETRRHVVGRFEKHGVEAGRVEVLAPTPTTAEHLALYGRIDVALDTFPYAGTTTTCEALWMGVPVVTLAGRSHASRVGASLLGAAGLGELVATDTQAYVRLARELAGDAGRLNSLRASLRERVASSILCDGPGFARRFGDALRGMWARYCEGRAGR